VKPKVLHICSDTNIGGAGRYVLTLLTQPEVQDRFEVAVACPQGALSAALERASIPVLPVEGADISFSVAALRSLYRNVRAWRPRIVHTHGSLAGRVAGVLAGARVVYTKHGLAAASEQAIQVRSPGALLKRMAVKGLAHRIVAVSEAIRRELEAAGADPQRLRVIPGGVPLADYKVTPLPAGVIGAVGRLSFEKGFDLLVEAMAQVEGARLILGGDGPQATALASQVRVRGLTDRVELTGFVPDIPAFLERIGLFVLPSRSEGLGLVLVEAMAAGRPVVAARVGGIPEVVVDGETGILVEPESPDALAAAIRRVLADPVLAGRMGQAGRRRAEVLFSASRMAAQTVSLYQELL